MHCRVRAEAASALREAAKRLAETESEVSQLRGDVHALQEELDNRPTAAEQRYVSLADETVRAEHSCLLLACLYNMLVCCVSSSHRIAGRTNASAAVWLMVDALHVKLRAGSVSWGPGVENHEVEGPTVVLMH
jgi:hypothetical protein